jgi:signal recognition particle subunit SRP54
MTPTERENPDVINGSRRKRIAEGSGTNIQEVNRLIKQFDETRKLMKTITTSKNPMRMMGNMPAMRGK